MVYLLLHLRAVPILLEYQGMGPAVARQVQPQGVLFICLYLFFVGNEILLHTLISRLLRAMCAGCVGECVRVQG